ncbi:MAG: PSD1 and planctomycete cytochrome C domain-containing protein [Mariniblastus sp.]|nr:PSD1 and planctomycete cytochrome C domain-containing protein [Mariniblastus sp.]
MKTAIVTFLLLVLGAYQCPITQGQQALEDRVKARHFTLQVLPILKSKCYGCHGNDPNNVQGDYDLRTRDTALKGGESGVAAIVVGAPDQSPLMEAVRWDGLEMPPKENDRLDETQIDILSEWIRSGAAWPDEQEQSVIRSAFQSSIETAEGVRFPTSRGQSDEWTQRTYQTTDVWAFQAFEKPRVPENIGHPIDAFIAKKLTAKNLSMAPRATAETLIRRASYDLTGLPPTPQEVTEFKLADRENPAKAWRELIDHFMAKPQYGERWAQHWLDVVRYADTSGLSNDFERSNAWRYRDYVVRSFNQDKPYNHFVIEQLAADDLVKEQERSEDGNNANGYHIPQAEAAVATGFLRMGPWEHTAMSPERVSRQNYLDDVVNAIGQSFLSTPLRCCKCHDHKFDPIPTRDYYRFYSALATTQPAEVHARFLPSENLAAFEEEKQHVSTLLEHSTGEQNRLYNKREAAAKVWYQEQGIPEQYVPFAKRRQMGDNSNKPRRFIGLTVEEEGILKVREGEVRIWTRRLERFQPLAQSVYYGGDLLMNSGKLRKPNNNSNNKKRLALHNTLPISYIYEGGSVLAPGEKVTPGVLSALQIPAFTGTEEDPYALPRSKDRRRLALARWIANGKNPLTKRSIVNRVWTYHFGKGLAGNPNNFGVSGKKPTHPELLNWLAEDFIESGWRIKRLHRLIMTSRAYQASTQHPDMQRIEQVDPSHDLLAVFQPRRLSAEEIRDSLLSASGELSDQVGGLPSRPEINLEVALAPRMVQFSLAPAYQPSRTPQGRNRRSLYAYRVRGLADPIMEVFNKPNSDESCELRDTASVSPQVFAMMNSDNVTKRSIAMAQRLAEQKDSIDQQIRYGFEVLGLKPPKPETLNLLVEHFNQMKAYHKKHPPKPQHYPIQLPRSVVEEFSGEACHYVERLDIYENYVPDLHPWDVTPDTRAMADICLLLFNSNEFIYVY